MTLTPDLADAIAQVLANGLTVAIGAWWGVKQALTEHARRIAELEARCRANHVAPAEVKVLRGEA